MSGLVVDRKAFIWDLDGNCMDIKLTMLLINLRLYPQMHFLRSLLEYFDSDESVTSL